MLVSVCAVLLGTAALSKGTIAIFILMPILFAVPAEFIPHILIPLSFVIILALQVCVLWNALEVYATTLFKYHFLFRATLRVVFGRFTYFALRGGIRGRFFSLTVFVIILNLLGSQGLWGRNLQIPIRASWAKREHHLRIIFKFFATLAEFSLYMLWHLSCFLCGCLNFYKFPQTFKIFKLEFLTE